MVGHLTVRPGDSVGARLDAANFAQIREAATTSGLLTDAELDQMLAVLANPTSASASPTMFTAWDRRP